MAVSIKFLGGVQTVTGSCHLISLGKTEVLLDAGLFQGRREESYLINTVFNYNPRQIKALVLSHAHIDHCGNIPSLIRKGMRCKIYATHATKDLALIMLEDSAKIQEEDIKYVNKINRRLGRPLRKILYNKKDVANAVRRIHPLAYEKKTVIAKDTSLTLYNAGHILGSSVAVLDFKDGKNNIRLGYAVDLGRKNLPMLDDPQIPKGLDYLILESTYGGRMHTPIEQAKIRLRDTVNRTLLRGGKILIPAFSLERTQEVIYLLNELIKEKAIPIVPVYVDSPLSMQITELFTCHTQYMNDKTCEAINRGDSPFEFLNLRFVHDQKESKSLNIDKRQMIIIAGSGMCESGRMLHHLKNNIEDTRNTVLVVGYMAKDTLGRKIVERSRIVRIFGVECELNAEVVVINALSGHADKNDFVDFVTGCLPLKRVFLVHGDEEQTQILYDTLSQKGYNVYIPSKNEEVNLA
ncbi:MAG: MBL fold metallo-hydrolase [Candidatus Omnitrophota bacterium]